MRQWTWGRRWTVRAVSFLLAAFAVLGGLAIQGHQKAEAYQRYLANSRRHAFAELSTGLNELDADLQKGIYATSPAMLTSLCTQIFGKAMSAQMALGELPYGSIDVYKRQVRRSPARGIPRSTTWFLATSPWKTPLWTTRS